MQVPLHRLYLGTQLVYYSRLSNVYKHQRFIPRICLQASMFHPKVSLSGWAMGLDFPYWISYLLETPKTERDICLLPIAVDVLSTLCSPRSRQSLHTKYFSAELVITFLSDLCEQQVQMVFARSHQNLWSCHISSHNIGTCTCPSWYQQDPKICDL